MIKITFHQLDQTNRFVHMIKYKKKGVSLKIHLLIKIILTYLKKVK
jgi:hypothetical protein